LYADDIILISPSVLMLQHLLHACEIELTNIDMAIIWQGNSIVIGRQNGQNISKT